jgi:hypothetical protein
MGRRMILLVNKRWQEYVRQCIQPSLDYMVRQEAGLFREPLSADLFAAVLDTVKRLSIKTSKIGTERNAKKQAYHATQTKSHAMAQPMRMRKKSAALETRWVGGGWSCLVTMETKRGNGARWMLVFMATAQ